MKFRPESNDRSDSDLIASVLINEDRDAFGVLVLRHQAKVRGLLRSLANGDAALADDLAQETFMKAFRAIRSFRNESRFDVWLYRIARNLFVSHIRSCKTKTEEPFSEEAHDGSQPAHDRQIHLRHDLTAAFDRLGMDERSVIELCFRLGLTHEEAAATLDWPLGTVKTVIATARKRLQRDLGEWQEGGIV